MRASQRWFVTAADEFIKHHPAIRSGGFKAVSLVPSQLEGTGSEPGRTRSHLRVALRGAGIHTAVIGLDCSYNEDLRPPQDGLEPFETHLTVHAWAFIPAREFEAARSELQRFFPRTETVPRPIYARDFDGELAGIAYGYKTTFARRQTLPRVVSSEGQTNRRRNTRVRPLRSQQLVELLITLHRAGLRKRLFLKGVKIAEDDHGRMVLRARPPPG
jgi:hypothetical protein